jgi:HEPN domain-containing protein
MSVANDRLEVVRQWVVRAEADWSASVHLLTTGDCLLLGIACFHAQQCVEKYIKAKLAESGVDPPKTHSIQALRVLLPGTTTFPLSVV